MKSNRLKPNWPVLAIPIVHILFGFAIQEGLVFAELLSNSPIARVVLSIYALFAVILILSLRNHYWFDSEYSNPKKTAQQHRYIGTQENDDG